MRTLGKVIKIASTDKQPLNHILCRLLRTYIKQPHTAQPEYHPQQHYSVDQFASAYQKLSNMS